MEFSAFKIRLHKKIGTHRYNHEAQQLMAPFKLGNRTELLEMNNNPRLGGVLILVFNKGGKAYLSLIRRPEYDGVHSGQIAFPGGQKDDSDSNIQETALRETFEEVGVLLKPENILGKISQVYIPPSKFLVTPFVAVLDENPVFNKDDFEVAEVLEVPLSLLFDDSIIKSGTVDIGSKGMKMTVPYFDVFGHKVWGATAIMLSEFKAILQ